MAEYRRERVCMHCDLSRFTLLDFPQQPSTGEVLALGRYLLSAVKCYYSGVGNSNQGSKGAESAEIEFGSAKVFRELTVGSYA